MMRITERHVQLFLNHKDHKVFHKGDKEDFVSFAVKVAHDVNRV